MTKPSIKVTEEQILFLKALKEIQKLSWDEIVDSFNKKFGENRTGDSLRKYYYRYSDLNFETDEDVILANVKNKLKITKRNSLLAKENKRLSENTILQEDLLEELKGFIKGFKVPQIKITKPRNSPGRKNLALELLISDIHFGLKTDHYNTKIATNRMQKVAETTLKEMNRLRKDFNLTKLTLLLNGDIMQGNNLHSDSHASCETTDSEQVVDSVRILFYHLIAILAPTGVPIEIIGIAGNHDRSSKDRPIVNPGKSYLTWTIYNVLKMLTIATKLDNVTWTIPNKEYHVYEMFGNQFIVEHGHAPGIKPDPKSLESQLLKRANQLGIVAKGIRIGHFHQPLVSGIGRHIVNGALGGSDHFSEHHGWKTEACQMLSVYVDTKHRDTSYWYSFQINVGNIGE